MLKHTEYRKFDYPAYCAYMASKGLSPMSEEQWNKADEESAKAPTVRKNKDSRPKDPVLEEFLKYEDS